LPIPKARRCPKRWRRSRCPQPRCVMPLNSRHEIIVEWGDCDPAGIVYYPSYFRWCDQATYRLFLKAGMRRDDISSGQWKEGTPLVAAECSFRRASQTGETLVIESHVTRFGRSSFTISHVFRDASGEVAAEGTETRIWARKEGDARSLQAAPIPEDVKRKLGG
jgi:4-hydroxybenzoyl-CoA thioesterase